MTVNDTHFSKRERWAIALAFLATAILTLIPFFSVGFTTSDDLQYFCTARQSWSYWLFDHKLYAQNQGRFYFLLTKYFYYVPYLVDNFTYTKLVQYVTLLLCYALFSYLVYRISRSQTAALLVILVMLLNTAINGQGYFIATTAYPFFFTFSFLIFMSGILLYVNHYQHKDSQKARKTLPLWGSLLFFVAALFYENYLVFIILMMIYIFARHWRRDGFTTLWRNRRFYLEIIPPALAIILYTAIYVGYRNYLEATLPEVRFYGGATLNESTFSLQNFFTVVRRCTLITLPGNSYFYNKGYIYTNSLELGGHRNTPQFILGHASITVWFNALLQCGLFLFFTKRWDLQHLSWKKAFALLGGAIAFAFSANMLIAVTPKYNSEWASWLKGYVTSFYSYFGTALVIVMVVALLMKLAGTSRWNRVVRIVFSILILFFSIIIGYSNDHLGREWQRSQNRFVLLDKMGKDGAFDRLPDNAIIYTEEIHKLSSISYSIVGDGRDLENYMRLHSGCKREYAVTKAELQDIMENHPDIPICYLHAIENDKSQELLITLTCEGETQCYYLSPSKHVTFFYMSDGQWQCLDYHSDRPGCKFTNTTINDPAIDPTTITVSSMYNDVSD